MGHEGGNLCLWGPERFFSVVRTPNRPAHFPDVPKIKSTQRFISETNPEYVLVFAIAAPSPLKEGLCYLTSRASIFFSGLQPFGVFVNNGLILYWLMCNLSAVAPNNRGPCRVGRRRPRITTKLDVLTCLPYL